MTQRERYNLVFKKKFSWKHAEFFCRLKEVGQLDHDSLAKKLTLMHRVECQGLIDEIEAAENNEYYEEFFAIDNDAAADDDEIHIKPPYVVIDKHDIIPFQDITAMALSLDNTPDNIATPCSVKAFGACRLPPNLLFQNGIASF